MTLIERLNDFQQNNRTPRVIYYPAGHKSHNRCRVEIAEDGNWNPIHVGVDEIDAAISSGFLTEIGKRRTGAVVYRLSTGNDPGNNAADYQRNQLKKQDALLKVLEEMEANGGAA